MFLSKKRLKQKLVDTCNSFLHISEREKIISFVPVSSGRTTEHTAMIERGLGFYLTQFVLHLVIGRSEILPVLSARKN